MIFLSLLFAPLWLEVTNKHTLRQHPLLLQKAEEEQKPLVAVADNVSLFPRSLVRIATGKA